MNNHNIQQPDDTTLVAYEGAERKIETRKAEINRADIAIVRRALSTVLHDNLQCLQELANRTDEDLALSGYFVDGISYSENCLAVYEKIGIGDLDGLADSIAELQLLKLKMQALKNQGYEITSNHDLSTYDLDRSEEVTCTIEFVASKNVEVAALKTELETIKAVKEMQSTDAAHDEFSGFNS